MRKFWVWLIVLLVIAGIFLFWSADFFTEIMWYKNLGYTEAFFTLLKLRIIPSLVMFLLIWAFLSFNWLFVQKSWERKRLREGEEPVRISRWVIFLVSLVVAIAFNSNLFIRWQDVVGFLGRNDFGIEDPLFHHDVSFYIFKLPLIESIYHTILGVIVITALAAVIVYLLTGGIRFSNRHLRMESEARFHILLLLLIGTVTGILGWQLLGYGLLESPTGVVYGAGYSDVYGKLLFYRIMQVLSIILVVVLVIDLFRGTYRPTAICFLVLVGVVFLGQFLPGVIQAYVVEPNELSKEKPYIENNLVFTRYAFGLDKITSSQFEPAASFSLDDWEDNTTVLENVRLWDWRALEKTFAQLQELRYYYQIGEIDIDRYVVAGVPRQVAIAPREINLARLTESADSWVNRHLIFTHGYGVVVSSLHDITDQGLPEMWVQDIPPKGMIKIERPEIYFGEKTNGYVIVNTQQKELDYPSGEDNVYTSYKGDGGVLIDSFLKKLLYAIRFRTSKIVLSSDITTDSRVMYYRNIKERVGKLAPFLKLDPDPYAVIANGRIYWLLDAYTVSDRFPYSQPIAGVGNYIRGSFKIVIDAYSGDVDIYLYDETDPLARAYKKVFPSLIRDKSQFPEYLVAHLRYPEQLFLAQAKALELYHMTNPEVFFNKEDIWEFPEELYQSDSIYMEPYYTMVRFPGAKNAEFVLMLPFTPKNKHNMVSWLAGRSDPTNYGDLVLYRFPKDRMIYGPMQIEARINQDPEISKLLSLWNQQGSTVQRGNHLVLPLNDSLLYVEPIYLQAVKGQIPELRLVVLSDGNNLTYGATFKEALGKLRAEGPLEVDEKAEKQEDGKDAGARDGYDGSKELDRIIDGQNNEDITQQSLAELAWEAFLEAEEAMKSGPDWEAYGRAQAKLKELLAKLNALEEK